MIIIKNGLIVDPANNIEEKGDIYIDEKNIERVITGANEAEEELRKKYQNASLIDASGMIVTPGFIDVHSHFRDPGFEYKEDIYTGANAAAAGGYTTVVLMCNTNPTVDNPETLWYVLSKGKETSIKVESCSCVSIGMKGEELVNFDEMIGHGAVGFTDDGIPLMDEDVLREAFKKAKGFPISLHEEDKSFIKENGINHGKASEHFGIYGSPREAEISLIERDIKIALEEGAVLNVQHISSKEGVELVRNAKKVKGNKIHAEATPGHFSLTEDAAIEKGTLAKLNPPFREESDRLAIIDGLKDGTIDIIATDHAPHAKEEKEKEITKAPSGIIGLETAYALANMHLVSEAGMSISDVIAKFTINPARLYNFDRGTLSEGKAADIAIFNPTEEWEVKTFKSKSSNSPFLGEVLKGKTKITICDGKAVYTDGTLI